MTQDYYSIGKSLIKQFNDINTIDEFLEILQDLDMLNSKGEELRKDFWKEWIEEKSKGYCQALGDEDYTFQAIKMRKEYLDLAEDEKNEKCENQFHPKTPHKEEFCKRCGKSKCSANFAYHICCPKDDYEEPKQVGFPCNT